MTGTLNKALLIGHLGQDPDIRTMNSGELRDQSKYVKATQ